MLRVVRDSCDLRNFYFGFDWISERRASELAFDREYVSEEATVVTIEEIGEALFSTWAMPFEIASLVLMVALIGAIVLASGEEGE